MMNFEEFKEMKKNMSDDEIEGMMKFADFFIKKMAKESPVAKLIMTHEENMNVVHEVIDKIMSKDNLKDKKKTEEKANKLIGILNQFTNAMKDFEKEEF